MTNEKLREKVLYSTVDPTIKFPANTGPGDMPALTTLLHRVCENNEERFEEAVRLIELFVDEALKQNQGMNQ